MYHVFWQDGSLKACDTSECNSVEEVESVLAQSGWAGQNWYGSVADTGDAAIEDALRNNFCDVPVEQMEALKSELKDVRSAASEWVMNPVALR